MQTKDIALILLIVFALALIADDSNSIRGKLFNFADSVDRRGVTGAVSGLPEMQSIEDDLKAAENSAETGDARFKEATKALDKLDWEGCISSCLIARDYFDISVNRFNDVIEELQKTKEGSKNKVLGAFVDKTAEYYSCRLNTTETKISICNNMESACLAYSHGEDEKGNKQKDIIDESLAVLEDTQKECDNLLEDINSDAE